MNRNRILIYLLILMLLLCSCSASTETAPAQQADSEISQTIEIENDSAENTNPQDQEEELEPILETESPEAEIPEINPSPTTDSRITPQEWQSWPIVPTLSPAMIEIYYQGLELGNRPEAFSKVGDCQIIPEVFLGELEDVNYRLPTGYEHLQEALDYFTGSFAREGQALRGGFVFPTVFSPLRADTSVCDPGETPFECELRVHQPSFVLISMEFRYDGRTAETHERYLRKAVEYALSRGIVPIVATKADNFEGDHSLNLTTAKIAYEYDLPLWNYWRAVQSLPDQGIDWERDSYGFHVTPEAWMVRNLTFLEVLDSIWKDVLSSQG
jgi:hypothetical protein